MDIKTFVFLDLETTGLPALENNTTKITELSIISVQAEHILLGAVPRVQNKLNLCFNPEKLISHVAEDLTGLSNSLLEYQSSFNEVSLNLLINFLERLQKPLCFVAHNGNSFDYPILKAHIEKISSDFIKHVYCIDSLIAFRRLLSEDSECQTSNAVATEKEFNLSAKENDTMSDEWDSILLDEIVRLEEKLHETSNGDVLKVEMKDIQKLNETTPVKKKPNTMISKDVNLRKIKKRNKSVDSENDVTDSKSKVSARRCLNFNKQRPSFKLVNIYERLLKKKPDNAHQAESDVQMMLQCAIFLGEKFIKWANENAILFSQIEKMKLGVKISKTYN